MLFKWELRRIVKSPLFFALIGFLFLTRFLVTLAAAQGLSVFDRGYDEVADAYISQVEVMPIAQACRTLEAENTRLRQYAKDNDALQKAIQNKDTSAYTQTQIESIVDHNMIFLKRSYGLSMVLGRAQALRGASKITGVSVGVIHERGYLHLAGLYIWDAVPAALFVLLLPAFLLDRRTGMSKLIAATRDGARLLFHARLGAAAALSAVLWTAETGADLIFANQIEPLSYLTHPIQCLDPFLFFPLHISIWGGMIAFYFAKLMFYLLLAVLLAWTTSGRRRRSSLHYNR